MKKDSLLDSMEYIDGNLIEEAENDSPAVKKNNWVKWGGLAACVCICAAGAALLWPALKNAKRNTLRPAETSVPSAAFETGANSVTNGLPVPEEAEREENTHAAIPSGRDAVSGNGPEIPAPCPAGVETPAPAGGDDAGDFNGTQMLGGIGENSLDADLAVNNGCVVLTESLKKAIDEYYDTVTYRVVAVLFRDGVAIDSGCDLASEEQERLAAAGYTVAYETYEDPAGLFALCTLHATAEQLLMFPANPELGCYLSFYDEYLGVTDESGYPVINGTYQNAGDYFAGLTVPEKIPGEIQEIEQAFVNAIANGELPFLLDWKISDDPPCIIACVTLQDPDMREQFRSEYDPSGEYLRVVPSKAETAEGVLSEPLEVEVEEEAVPECP